jgi:hypothetical protein
MPVEESVVEEGFDSLAEMISLTAEEEAAPVLNKFSCSFRVLF